MAEIEDRLNKLRSPFRSAETFWIEEIVDPRDTRKILCEFVELAAPVPRQRPQPPLDAALKPFLPTQWGRWPEGPEGSNFSAADRPCPLRPLRGHLPTQASVGFTYPNSFALGPLRREAGRGRDPLRSNG